MNPKALLLFIFFIATHAIVLAQGKNFKMGYVVTTSNDTIRGLIKDDSDYQNSITVKFKADKNATVKTYAPQDLKSYFIGSAQPASNEIPTADKLTFSDVVTTQQAAKINVSNHKSYVSVQLTGTAPRHVFLREVVAGPAKLFFGKSVDKKDAFFLQVGEGAVFELSKANYLGLFQSQLKSCDKFTLNQEDLIRRKINLNIASLTKAVTSYNTCITPNGQVNINMHPAKVTTAFGVKGGLSISRIVYSDLYYKIITEGRKEELATKHDYRVGNSFGVFMNFDFKGRISLQPELLITSKGDKVLQQVIDPSTVAKKGWHENTIELKYLQIPILVQYRFLNKIWNPYFSFGPAIGKELSRKTSARFYNPETGFSRPKEEIPFDNFEIGGIIGMGIKRKIIKNHLFQLELRYDNSYVMRGPNPGFSNQAIQFQTGIGF